MRATHWLAGVAALVVMMGGGIAMADGDTPSLPLRGPISFEAFDVDGSGAIRQEEFAQVHARRDEAREQADLPPTSRRRAFGDLDGDGDGEITREEFQHAHGAAGPGRGRGPGTGRGWGMGRGEGPPAFSDFDLDDDGGIDEQEFVDARTKRIAERIKEGRKMRGLATPHTFADMDLDGDGNLTPEEFAAAVRSHQRGMGRGAPPGVKP